MKLAKYLPDVLVIAGVYLLSYNILRPSSYVDVMEDRYGNHSYYVEKALSITIIILGLDMAIRRYLEMKNNKLFFFINKLK